MPGIPGIGGATGALSGVIAQETAQNPFTAMMKYMDQASGDITHGVNTATGYLSPWLQAGQGALGHQQQMLAQEAHPHAFYNQMMSGYQMSPAQQFALHQGLGAVSNQAEMKGFGGSGTEAEQLAKYAQGQTSQDQQQYFHNLMGIHSQALQGYGALSQQGMGAGGQMGGWQMSAATQQANLAEAEAKAKAAQVNAANKAHAQEIGGAIGTAAMFA